MKSRMFSVLKIIYIGLIITLTLIESYLSFHLFEDSALVVVEIEETQYEAAKNHFQLTEQLNQTVSLNKEAVSRIKRDSIVYMVIERHNVQALTIMQNNELLAQVSPSKRLNIELGMNSFFVSIDTSTIESTASYDLNYSMKQGKRRKSDICFVSEEQFKQLLIISEVSYLIKQFLVFSSIMVALGFIGFSKIIIESINKRRAQSFYAASIGLIIFAAYNFMELLKNNLFIDLFFLHRVEDALFILSVSMLTLAFYFRIKDRIVRDLWILQVFISVFGISIAFLTSDFSVILTFVKLCSLLLAISISYVYLHYPQPEKHYINRLYMIRIVFFLIIGQLIVGLNEFTGLIPVNLTSIAVKTVPITIALYSVIVTVFRQFYTIQQESEVEHKKLKTLNTNIYEYISEGVFSVTHNLRINELYTKACHKIFDKDLSGMSVADLLCDKDTSVEFITRLLNDFFEDKIPWLACKELLPQELIIRQQYYEMNYLVIKGLSNKKEIVVRLVDISDRKELEDSLSFERDKLSLAITSLMNREELVPLVNEFIEYMQLNQFMGVQEVEILNTLHTFKGNFGVFSFIHVLKAVHEFETRIIAQEVITEEIVSGVREELYKDLEIISEITGSSFFEDAIYLKANINNLEGVYGEVKKYFYDTEASLIIYIIKKIFNKSLKDIILFYGREARKKALEKNKDIKTIEVTGDEVFLDYHYYRHALRSLVHIFNNCIDHGIEDEEERLLLGKPRAGEIQCRILDYGNFVEIMVKDDGRGIEVEKLTALLLKEGIITEEQLMELTEEEILDYVFLGEVSTLEETSMTSGRGVGLASVKREVENVGGEIRITSFKDFGTEVKILIPKENDTLISYFSLPLLMDLYVEAFKIYIKSNNIFELPLNVVGSEKITSLYEYNVKIRFEGPEVGYFFFSCNKEVLWKFASYLSDDINLTEVVFSEMHEEAIKETCNIIAGNSTSVFDLNQKYIFIASPELIDKEFFDQPSLIYKWHMKYGNYGAVLGLILD